MIYIPSSEITQPSFHADELGFVFKWNGHLLRGIYHDAVPQAKRYFESGFVEEIVNKGLFPKTWISEYENEQFGLIIEHQLIEPVTYATEWNFQMLKDAALMVLDIARIGYKYGYNMIDCHKMNVMFRNNYPVYVDLGSFVPNAKGVTGWKPYLSFLRSYYCILDVWNGGCSQIAKRMMAPHLEMHLTDYWAYKRPIYRNHRKLLEWHLKCISKTHDIASSELMLFQGYKKHIKTLINVFRLSHSQRLKVVRRKIESKKLRDKPIYKEQKLERLLDFLENHVQAKSITLINCGILSPDVLKHLNYRQIVSINADEQVSRKEYQINYNNEYNLQSVSYDTIIPYYTHGKAPEERFRSDIAIIGGINIDKNTFAEQNIRVLLDSYWHYSRSGEMIVLTEGRDELIRAINSNYSIESIIPEVGLLVKKTEI